MPVFTQGWNQGKEQKMRAVYALTRRCIDDAVSAMNGGPKSQLANDMMIKFFGFGLNDPRAEDVRRVVKSMRSAMKHDTFKLVEGGSRSDGTMAEAEISNAFSAKGGMTRTSPDDGTPPTPIKYIKIVKNVVNDLGDKLPITIYHEFFDLPIAKIDSSSQLNTFAHELSHHAAHTDDESLYLLPVTGYYAVRLAAATGKYSNNAENYAYFIQSFC